MASTIITKNNTTGTPGVSDLVQGELAINVGNGSLYYGAAGGTAVSQSFTFSDITASGGISAVGIIEASTINGIRLSQGGNLINDIYSPIAGGSGIVTVGTIGTGTWNGDVIAEAKLENQSGTNTGDNTANTTYSNVDNTSDANKPVSTAGQTALNLKSNIASPSFTGNITASGNISSSGDIYSSNLEILAGTSFKYADLDDGYYGMPGNNGWSNPSYGFQKTDGPDGLGNTNQHIGIIMPYKAILVGVIGQFRSSATGDFKMSLWTEKVEDGEGSTATDWTETILTDAITSDTVNRPFNFEKLDGTTAFVKGTSIIPAFYNGSGTDNVDIFGSFMVMVQRVV